MVYVVNKRMRRLLLAAAVFSGILLLLFAVTVVHNLLDKPQLSVFVGGLSLLMGVGLAVYAQIHLLFARHHKLDIETDDQGIAYVLPGSKVQRVPWSQIERMRVSHLKACIELQDRKGSCLFRLSFLKDNFPELYTEVYKNIAHERLVDLRNRYRAAWHVVALRYSSPLIFGPLLWGAITYGWWIMLVLLVILTIAAWREQANTVSGVAFDQDAMRIKYPFRSVVVRFEDIHAVSIAMDTSAGRHGVDTAFALEIGTNRFPEPMKLTALDADVHRVHAEICSRIGYDHIHHSPERQINASIS